MKMYQLNCPACGATVEIEQDRKSIFCYYCGSKIYLDDGVKRVEITKKLTTIKHIPMRQKLGNTNEKKRFS